MIGLCPSCGCQRQGKHEICSFCRLGRVRVHPRPGVLQARHGGWRKGAGRKPKTRTCANPTCGKAFGKSTSQYRSKFCSRICAKSARVKSDIVKICRCGVAFALDRQRPRRACSDACALAARKAAGSKGAAWAKANLTVYEPRACEQCSGIFRRNPNSSKKSKDTLRFCGWACSHEWHRRSGVPRRGAHCPVTIQPCAGCGALFTRRSSLKRTVCSDGCAADMRARAKALRVAPTITVAPRPAIACLCCHAVFVPAGRRTIYCSTVCCRKMARRSARRRHGHHSHSSESRARHKGVKVDYSITPLKVCARDGWRCQLCGRSTPRRLRGTYLPNAPEVDHIIPFDAGGAHTWENVQCACRKCNGDKKGKPLGQLRLAV